MAAVATFADTPINEILTCACDGDNDVYYSIADGWKCAHCSKIFGHDLGDVDRQYIREKVSDIMIELATDETIYVSNSTMADVESLTIARECFKQGKYGLDFIRDTIIAKLGDDDSVTPSDQSPKRKRVDESTEEPNPKRKSDSAKEAVTTILQGILSRGDKPKAMPDKLWAMALQRMLKDNADTIDETSFDVACLRDEFTKAMELHWNESRAFYHVLNAEPKDKEWKWTDVTEIFSMQHTTKDYTKCLLSIEGKLANGMFVYAWASYGPYGWGTESSGRVYIARRREDFEAFLPTQRDFRA